MDTTSVAGLVRHAGVLTGAEVGQALAAGRIRVNGSLARADQPVAPGDCLRVSGSDYEVVPAGGGRQQLVGKDSHERGAGARIPGLTRVHAGYHKCLTEFSKKVYRRIAPNAGERQGFRHYFHRLDTFYGQCRYHAINSVSGHSLDLERFEDVRVVRFIRDPRDLLVSGYHYHRRAAEHWCELVDPVDEDWAMVRGHVPASLPSGISFSDWLNTVSAEEGLLAEMDFRLYHFQSMLEWPREDSRVRLYRYEDILGREARVFRDVLGFMELPWFNRLAGMRYARKFRAEQRIGRYRHIRNPRSGQWRSHFTPELNRAFNERYGAILERYGYPLE